MYCKFILLRRQYNKKILSVKVSIPMLISELIKQKLPFIGCGLLIPFLTAYNNNNSRESDDNLTKENATTPKMNYAVINTYPHYTTPLMNGY